MRLKMFRRKSVPDNLRVSIRRAAISCSCAPSASADGTGSGVSCGLFTGLPGRGLVLSLPSGRETIWICWESWAMDMTWTSCAVLLLGGGIGVPPMLELAAALSEGSAQTAGEQTSQKGDGDHSAAQEAGEAPAGVTAVMGYRNHELFLLEEMKKYAAVFAATEDGSAGTKGNVLDAVRENGIEADVICACGPLPMLRAVSRYASEKGIKAFLSLEERMACGVGVCLGCVTKTKHVDEHSKVHNARVCVEGPVFPADEVDLD